MFCNFCEKFENSKWPPFLARQNFFENWHGYSTDTPCGSKISSKSLYLAGFSRYKHFYVLQYIQKNSPRLLPKPAKFEKNPPNGYRVIRKTKCGAGGAAGAGSSPIHKQASLAGRLINKKVEIVIPVKRESFNEKI